MADFDARDIGQQPFILAASTTQSRLQLDPQRQYYIRHNGSDSTGAATTIPVFWGTESGVSASFAQGANRNAVLVDGFDIIGPGLTDAYFICASGTPTLSIHGSEHLRGQF